MATKANLKVVATTGKASGGKSKAKLAVVDKGKQSDADFAARGGRGGTAASNQVDKAPATAAAKPNLEANGYKGHRAGSRKGTVRKVFDKDGREKAFAAGKAKGLKPSTLNQWLNTWARA